MNISCIRALIYFASNRTEEDRDINRLVLYKNIFLLFVSIYIEPCYIDVQNTHFTQPFCYYVDTQHGLWSPNQILYLSNQSLVDSINSVGLFHTLTRFVDVRTRQISPIHIIWTRKTGMLFALHASSLLLIQPFVSSLETFDECSCGKVVGLLTRNFIWLVWYI